MAAPTQATILDLNGNWQMDKSQSEDWDAILKLQGISWMTRKAIGLATITLGIKEYKDENDVTRIDISQTLTGGIPGTTERRVTNWTENDHTDHIFGSVKGWSRLVQGKEVNGKVRPDVDVQTKVGVEKEDEVVPRFLRGEVSSAGEAVDGFEVDEGGVWLQSWVKSVDNGWTAEQIWGFETINGERRHSRRVVVAKDGKVEKVRLIYSYIYE